MRINKKIEKVKPKQTISNSSKNAVRMYPRLEKKSLSDREQSQKSGNESRNVVSTERGRKNGIKSEMLSLKRKRTLLRRIGNEKVELLN